MVERPLLESLLIGKLRLRLNLQTQVDGSVQLAPQQRSV